MSWIRWGYCGTQLNALRFPTGNSTGPDTIHAKNIWQPQRIKASRFHITGESHKASETKTSLCSCPGKNPYTHSGSLGV